MRLGKKGLILGVFAVAAALGLSRCDDEPQQGPVNGPVTGGNMPVAPAPQEPKHQPLTGKVEILPPQIDLGLENLEKLDTGTDVLSARDVELLDYCHSVFKGMKGPMVTDEALRIATYGVVAQALEAGAALDEYQKNYMCENVMMGVTQHALRLKPEQCVDAVFDFNNVGVASKFAVPLCRDDKKIVRESTVTVAPAGVKLIP